MPGPPPEHTTSCSPPSVRAPLGDEARQLGGFLDVAAERPVGTQPRRAEEHHGGGDAADIEGTQRRQVLGHDAQRPALVRVDEVRVVVGQHWRALLAQSWLAGTLTKSARRVRHCVPMRHASLGRAAVLLGVLLAGAGRAAAARRAAAAAGLPPLDAATSLLVVAPHPDDETLCCAGVMQRVAAAGGHVSVVWVTSGDASELDLLLVEHSPFMRAGCGARAGDAPHARGARGHCAARRAGRRPAVSRLSRPRRARAAHRAPHAALYRTLQPRRGRALCAGAVSRASVHRRQPRGGFRRGARARPPHPDPRAHAARQPPRSSRHRPAHHRGGAAPAAAAGGALLDRARRRGLAQPARARGRPAARRPPRACAAWRRPSSSWRRSKKTASGRPSRPTRRRCRSSRPSCSRSCAAASCSRTPRSPNPAAAADAASGRGGGRARRRCARAGDRARRAAARSGG